MSENFVLFYLLYACGNYMRPILKSNKNTMEYKHLHINVKKFLLIIAYRLHSKNPQLATLNGNANSPCRYKYPRLDLGKNLKRCAAKHSDIESLSINPPFILME